MISAGGRHTAAIKNDGTLWTWGSNDYGQLGDADIPIGAYSDTNNSRSTVPVKIGDVWLTVSAGELHTAAINKDGKLFAWGYNGGGMLGDGTTVNKNTPTYISAAGDDWIAVSAGSGHTAAIKKDGTLWIWGYNYWGQLGDSTTGHKNTPTYISAAGDDWIAVSTGMGHTAAINKDGKLFAWGNNELGQLGDGTKGNKNTPTYISAAGDDWIAVSAGWRYTVAIKKDGRLFAWGDNSYGQLGDGSQTQRLLPVHIASAGDEWITVSAEYYKYHTAAIKSDGSLWTWGDNFNDQLGINGILYSSTPVQVKRNRWIGVSAGYLHTVAIKTDGTLWAWGNNNYGQLGDGTTTGRAVPVGVAPSD